MAKEGKSAYCPKMGKKSRAFGYIHLIYCLGILLIIDSMLDVIGVIVHGAFIDVLCTWRMVCQLIDLTLLDVETAFCFRAFKGP